MESTATAAVVEEQLDAPATAGPEDVNKAKVEPQKRDWPWKKAKKVAVMISFCGKDYLGMQRNPGFKTIEEELMKAFRDSGTIPDEWFDNMQLSFFQRASRTDKGVSAAKMIISLKLLCEGDLNPIIEKINSFLPPEIRVHAIKRVTKNFNSKTACDARTYLYMMPTFAFAPIFPVDIPTTDSSKENISSKLETAEEKENDPSQNEDSQVKDDGNDNVVTEDKKATNVTNSEDFIVKLNYRMSPEVREKVNQVLQHFVGPHYFHNYTSGKLPLEPSSQRYIYSFECGEPFIRSNMEFVVIKVKGQSFMLHQIRKMVGMTIAVVRGHASVDTIEKTWGVDRIDIPRAPGLGLLLEEVHYDRYNQRFGKDGFHETLSWEKQASAVEEFKEKFIYPEMIDGEVKEFSMFEWLKFLPIHTFSPRHFESEDNPKSPLNAAAKRVYQTDEGKNGSSKKSKMEEENGVGDDDDE